MWVNGRWQFWVLIVVCGVAAGRALQCQTPLSHVKVGMGEDCATCHQSDFQRATEPLHAGNLSQRCADCHGNTSWSPARGNPHASFPLEGAHAIAACNSCHTGDPAVYAGTPTGCVSCHGAQRDQVTEPSHAAFSDQCQTCHTTAAWQPAAFDHPFPLEGGHADVACKSCHTGAPAVYADTPTACVSCHAAQRDQVTEPSHAAFSDQCQTCHTAAAWRPAAFDHPWPLVGAHASATCASCHGQPPAYAGTPTDCASCHTADLAQAVNPPHDGFSSDCSSCHNSISFSAASFAHTDFPLTGAHVTVECRGCHSGTPAVFAGTATDCVGCHRQDYDSSPYPGHASFPTTCQDCHATTAWTPASGGTHPQNRFSITGVHKYACNDCHDQSLGPNGAGNTNCVGCHDGAHTLARMDNVHAGEVRNYPTGPNRAPNFCLACHAGGTGGD
jgi:hypothetical protein